MKKRLNSLGALLFVAALTLSGCAATPDQSEAGVTQASDGLLADHDLDDLDTKQIIDRLDTLPVAERSTDLFASIKTDALMLSDQQGREVSLDMPAEEFYVSIAPYVSQTHDCFFHSLTTCLGELQDEEIQVNITAADGTVLVDETRQTFSNGFLGFWLPKDIDATITLERDGQTVSAPLSTYEDDPTCLTTLQLT